MITFVKNSLNRIFYLYRSIGVKSTLLRIIQKLISPIYKNEVGYITLISVPRGEIHYLNKNHNLIKCITMETGESLLGYENHTSRVISLKEINKFLSVKPSNILIIAIRSDSTNSNRIIGYAKCVKGEFHAFGIQKKLSSHTLFNINTEVDSQFRGQRINRLLVEEALDYCQKNGIDKIFGVILAHNQSSLKSHIRWEENYIIGKIEFRSFLGGLSKKLPPWGEIKKIIEN